MPSLQPLPVYRSRTHVCNRQVRGRQELPGQSERRRRRAASLGPCSERASPPALIGCSGGDEKVRGRGPCAHPSATSVASVGEPRRSRAPTEIKPCCSRREATTPSAGIQSPGSGTPCSEWSLTGRGSIAHVGRCGPAPTKAGVALGAQEPPHCPHTAEQSHHHAANQRGQDNRVLHEGAGR